MTEQLELTTTVTPANDAPAITVGISQPLWKRLHRLQPDARQEFARRVGIAAEQAYETLAEVRSLSSEALFARHAIARRDVEILAGEIERRAGRPAGTELPGIEPLHA